MSTTVPGCYAGKILRVDLTNNHIWTQPWTPEMCRTLLGGVGLGAKILGKKYPQRCTGTIRRTASSWPRDRSPGSQPGAPGASRW